MVDRITLAPPTKWMPLVHYREPKRNDIVVFIKPCGRVNGSPVSLPGQAPASACRATTSICTTASCTSTEWRSPSPQRPGRQHDRPRERSDFLDEFPAVPPVAQPGATTEAWAVDFPNHVKDGDLVVPPGKYFMMGDNRHDSLDSRYWGFVPRENIVGRPLFNYWSFKTPDNQYEQTGIGTKIAWMGHVALHFFTDTRWSRTLKLMR